MEFIKYPCKHCGELLISTEYLEKTPAEEPEFCAYCLKMTRDIGEINKIYA